MSDDDDVEWCGCPTCDEEANGGGILCGYCSQEGCSTSASACGLMNTYTPRTADHGKEG